MNEIFLNEWKQYRQGLARPAFQGEAPRGEAAFDESVKVGEIRIFADANRPLVALILEEKGLAGRRIVPISPFSVPASSRERLVGARVFQLWNTCTAARRFTDRSWLVDTLSAEEVSLIQAAVATAYPGRVTAGDSPLARYEREFLVSGGTFVPFVRTAANESAVDWAAKPSFVSTFTRVAASFALCVGAFYLLIGAGRERLRVWREASALVCVAQDPEVVELADMPAEDGREAELCENDQFGINFINESAPVVGSVPTTTQRCMVALARLRNTPNLPSGAMHLSEGDALIDPCVLPLSVIDCGAGGVLMSVSSGTSAHADRACPPPTVDCRSAVCPWDAAAKLVAIRLSSEEAARIEVYFDKEQVGGYRLVSGPGSELVYEVVPRGNAGLADGFCQVTTRWTSSAGESRRVESVRSVDSIDVTPPASRPHATDATSPDDVPVDVRF